MGILEELGKAALKGVAQGVAQGIQAHSEREAEQRRQAARNASANERDAQQEAEKGNIDAMQYLASSALQQKDYQNAVYWATKGAEYDDDFCLYVLGMGAYSLGDKRTAVNAFTRNVNVNGDGSSAKTLGYIYMEANDIDNALHFFEIALNVNGNDGEAALGAANCIMSVADRSNALEVFEHVRPLLQIASRSEDHQVREGAQYVLRQIQEAEKDIRQQQNNSCFITTAVCDSFGKADDCYELTTFRHFRDDWLVLQPDGKQLVDEYYAVAPRIVAGINRLVNAAQIYKDIWREYLAPCLTFIELGDQSSCKAKYVDMVHHLKKLYL